VFVLVIILFMVVAWFLPRVWPGVDWFIFSPAILCGQQSLQTFCTGIFLSFAAYFVLVETTNAIWMQILVNILGITILCLLAWYRSWTTSLDKPVARPETLASPQRGSPSAKK